MNERIDDLMYQAGLTAQGCLDKMDDYDREAILKFAELIVRECVMVIEDRTISQIGKEGVGWTNGYGDGLKTGAWLIKQHFGVEE